MTPREFCEGGKYDGVKGAFHGVMLAGAACCAAYNIAAWCYRRQPRNAVNGIVYSALVALELVHVKHHTEHS